ncbi:hypothetical protein [Turicibacter sp. H121]|uniref:hypothetical protein n=2 Tax=Turicibacter sp. H121 TaxID=1712675 RepID=UPI00130DCF29|nr:hypothetical protein [Turicibacter sp. H121]
MEREKVMMELLEMIAIGYHTFLYVPVLLTVAYICTFFYQLMIGDRDWTYEVVGKIFLGIISIVSIAIVKMVVLHLVGPVLIKQSLLFFQTLIAIEFLLYMSRYSITPNLLKSKLRTLCFIPMLFFFLVQLIS